MKEIKFRVWNTEANKMIINVKEMGVFALKSIYTIDEFLVIPTNEKYPLMQYTGKKDKNDIEIYDGDLFKPFYDDGEIHEVIWHEESASFRVATYLDNLHGGTFAELFFMDDINEECNEVIGNIYENPELLESGK